MIAFKGFNSRLSATMGKGIYQFEIGRTERTGASKTARNGFHCCENPFECMAYYPIGSSRYCMVEAGGSIDEAEDAKISCTELTPVKELSLKELAGYGMVYMIEHPKQKWQQRHTKCVVCDDKADTNDDGIAIARGLYPKVRGRNGSILGMILEPKPGRIKAARLVVVGSPGIKPGVWYTLTGSGSVKEADGQ